MGVWRVCDGITVWLRPGHPHRGLGTATPQQTLCTKEHRHTRKKPATCMRNAEHKHNTRTNAFGALLAPGPAPYSDRSEQMATQGTCLATGGNPLILPTPTMYH